MKIIDVRAFQPSTPGSPPDWRTQLGQIIIQVDTDDGLTGLGVGGGGAAGIHVVHTVLRDLLLGEPVDDVERLHAAMCRHTAFYGRKGLVVMALSGVDLALWDLRGKRRESGVAQLLSPDVDAARRWPTYLTVFDDVEAERAMAEGHQAIKLHVERFGDQPDPRAIGELVARTRERLGAAATIMIDAFARWDLESTLRVADILAPHGVAWLEEPLRPDDLAGYEVLSRRSPIPIAGGEHEYLEQGFRELIDRGLHAVLQPDVNWCGGLTTLVQVYRMAREAGCASVRTVVANRSPCPRLRRLDSRPLAESPRKWFRALRGGPRWDSGAIRLATGHGFGVELTRESARVGRHASRFDLNWDFP